MKRTGNSKVAVVGWGRGMGHTGHMFLAHAVIQQAKDMNADPYFFISKTIGKDDPIYPEEKLKIYQTVFPQYANIFEPQSNLNQALIDLAKLGYKGVVLVVGADQKQAFQYLEKPNKEGVPVYQSFGFDKLKVISRQETRSKYAQQEGPRATPMREILMNPNATEQDKFSVWRRDMPKVLSDEQVLELMQKAEQRMKAIPSKAKKIKEFISRVRPLLKESTTEQKIKVLKLLKEFAADSVVEGDVIPLDARRPTEMSAEFINWLRANYPNLPIKDLKDPQKRNALYREFQNSQQLDEKWTEKYKRSIDCSNPKGFSQRAHCQGRKKNKEIEQVEERKKKKRKKSRKSVYGPVPYYGWYGMNPGYSSEAGSDGGGDGGGMEEAKVYFTDPNARVSVFYKNPKLVKQNKVLKLADSIPYKVLDRFIQMVSTKYQIKPEEIFWTDVTKKTLESQDYLDEK